MYLPHLWSEDFGKTTNDLVALNKVRCRVKCVAIPEALERQAYFYMNGNKFSVENRPQKRIYNVPLRWNMLGWLYHVVNWKAHRKSPEKGPIQVGNLAI